MPRGDHVKKGMRYGGRQKGTPNKKTTERVEAERIARQAQAEVDKAAIAKVKLAKDVLEDYVGAFHNMAAYYQNRVAAAFAAGREPTAADIAAFEKWGTLTAQTAKNLAEFQSPKFKAIAIAAPPPSPNVPTADPAKVVDITDPVKLARVYQQLVKQPA